MNLRALVGHYGRLGTQAGAGPGSSSIVLIRNAAVE